MKRVGKLKFMLSAWVHHNMLGFNCRVLATRSTTTHGEGCSRLRSSKHEEQWAGCLSHSSMQGNSSWAQLCYRSRKVFRWLSEGQTVSFNAATMISFISRTTEKIPGLPSIGTINKIGNSTQGCVLSPLLFTLLTHYRAAIHILNHIIKFADDMTIVCLISKKFLVAGGTSSLYADNESA